MNKTEIIEEFKKLAKAHPELTCITISFNGGSDDGWADPPDFLNEAGKLLEINEGFFNDREVSYNILAWTLGSDWTIAGSIYGTIIISEDGVKVDGERDEPVPFYKEME